jgi:hypothetical protein
VISRRTIFYSYLEIPFYKHYLYHLLYHILEMMFLFGIYFTVQMLLQLTVFYYILIFIHHVFLTAAVNLSIICLIMKISSSKMCSMQIVGVYSTFCMETNRILLPKHKLHCLGFEWNVDIYTSVLVYMYDFLQCEIILSFLLTSNSISIQIDHNRSCIDHLSIKYI